MGPQPNLNRIPADLEKRKLVDVLVEEKVEIWPHHPELLLLCLIEEMNN